MLLRSAVWLQSPIRIPIIFQCLGHASRRFLQPSRSDVSVAGCCVSQRGFTRAWTLCCSGEAWIRRYTILRIQWSAPKSAPWTTHYYDGIAGHLVWDDVLCVAVVVWEGLFNAFRLESLLICEDFKTNVILRHSSIRRVTALLHSLILLWGFNRRCLISTIED